VCLLLIFCMVAEAAPISATATTETEAVTESADTAAVDGRTQDFTEFKSVKDNVYSVFFCGIYASEYNADVCASFSRNGDPIGNTLKYRVNTYICSMQDCGNGQLSALVKAMYNYGKSALEYYNERITKK